MRNVKQAGSIAHRRPIGPMPYSSAAKLLSAGSILFVLLPVEPANAACVFSPTLGDDIHLCDSGTSPGGLTDTSGNNTLLLPDGGTGMLNGNVVFGAGQDRVEIASGSILGNVQQGAGIDDFRMTGGTIESLNQGDNLDTFFMSGGRIVDFFDDGDRAVMTGGRIGRVNMKLDQNYFEMSGGVIDRNLVTGFDIDTIILSDGFIGGNISVSGGADSVAVTGGAVGGSVLMSFGTDAFVWDGGGIIYGAVDMGPDADTARLSNLTAANLGATTQFDGGLGTDSLALENVAADGIGRFVNWETIDAGNDTELVFDGTLVLGDTGTGTGTLSVDATSTLFGGGGNFGISGAAGPASLVNAGRIDLTNGAGGAGDRFTVGGNYIGDSGLLLTETVLGDDASVSDRLVISGGAASGATSIGVVNAGGAGALTVADGILLVEAINGGSTGLGAFALAARVAAGPYEYLLFRGGVSAGTDENWYLRSTLTPGPAPAPVPDPTVGEVEPVAPEDAPLPPPLAQPAPPPPPEATPADPDPVDPAPPVDLADAVPLAPPDAAPADAADPPPAPPQPAFRPAPVPGASAPPNPGATPVAGDVVPLYRTEVATYSAIAPVAHHLAHAALGTFHERRGDQPLLDGSGTLPAGWARLYGQDFDIGWQGTVTPSVDVELAGFQLGQDLWGSDSDGHARWVGVFVGYSRLSGDITGQALGWNGYEVGDIDADAFSFGGYFTHVGPTGWYLDAVLMGSRFGGDARSASGQSIDISGNGVTASLEGGYPVALAPGWTLEPQAQLIWQNVSLDDRADRFSGVSFDADDVVTGRIGLRLEGEMDIAGMPIRPYLKANLWHDLDGTHTASFAGTPIGTAFGGTRFEFGGGVVANVADSVSAFATADYSTDLGGDTSGHAVEANVGLRIRW